MRNLLRKTLKYVFLFGTGGFIYCLIEILSRGYTHWTMGIVGGICFILLGLINNFLPWHFSITTQMLIGMILITGIEFISGCVLNLWLGLNIWDYTEEQYNILGQISMKHCIYWFLLSGIGIVLDDCLRYILFDEDKPYYYL